MSYKVSDEDEIIFNDETIIVTDPCYLNFKNVPVDTAGKPAYYNGWDKVLDDTKYFDSNGLYVVNGVRMLVSSTGGDGSFEANGQSVCVDSGLLCVFSMDEARRVRKELNIRKRHCPFHNFFSKTRMAQFTHCTGKVYIAESDEKRQTFFSGIIHVGEYETCEDCCYYINECVCHYCEDCCEEECVCDE